MTTVTGLMTAEEFAQLPDPRGGERMELVRGAIVMAPPGNAGHGHRARKVERTIEDFVIRHNLGLTSGEGGYRLSKNPDTVRAPDGAWISWSSLKAHSFPEDDYPDAAPNLAIEIVSANDRDVDIAQQVRDFLDAGTDRVWVVRSKQRTVTVHRPNGDSHTYSPADTLTSEDAGFPVDGFELRVASIFET